MAAWVLVLLVAGAPVASAASCGGSSVYAGLVAGTGGVAGYWRLGEQAGSVACDVVGGDAGSYLGGVTLGGVGAIVGDPDGSITLDGSSGQVSVTASSTLAFGDVFAVEAWVKRAAVGTPGYQVVASKQNGSWALMFSSDNRLVLRRSNVGNVVASTTTVADTTAWHHVAATKSGGAVHLYVDGQDVTGPVADQTMVDNTAPLVIGQSSGSAFFNGSIDEVAVYKQALTATQVADHYRTGVTPPPPPASDPVIAAAGDIACAPAAPDYGAGAGTATACRQRYTSDLITGADLAAVLPLGDLQYTSGALPDFTGSYGPTWGRVKPITRPVPGNHEYETTAAAGYFDYFNGSGVLSGPAGDRDKGYYSWDLGSWHLIALNSECAQVGGCDRGSPQEQWLRADLAAHPSTCTLAYWHRPLFNSGTHGADDEMRPIWQALYEAHADIVLNGHAHDYERFAPQTPDGALDATGGIREIIAGTGGEDHYMIPSPTANSEIYNTDTFGVLRLTLHPASYDWRFQPETGGGFTDAGSAPCHR